MHLWFMLNIFLIYFKDWILHWAIMGKYVFYTENKKNKKNSYLENIRKNFFDWSLHPGLFRLYVARGRGGGGGGRGAETHLLDTRTSQFIDWISMFSENFVTITYLWNHFERHLLNTFQLFPNTSFLQTLLQRASCPGLASAKTHPHRCPSM